MVAAGQWTLLVVLTLATTVKIADLEADDLALASAKTFLSGSGAASRNCENASVHTRMDLLEALLLKLCKTSPKKVKEFTGDRFRD